MDNNVKPIWLDLKKEYIDDNIDKLLGYLNNNKSGSSDGFYKITLNLLRERVDELLDQISNRPLYAEDVDNQILIFNVKLLGGFLLAFPDSEKRMHAMIAMVHELRNFQTGSYSEGLISLMSRCLRHNRIASVPFSYKDLTSLSRETVEIFTFRLCQSVGGVTFGAPIDITMVYDEHGRLWQTSDGLTLAAPGAWTHPETLKSLVPSLPTPNGCCRFATPKGDSLKNHEDILAVSKFSEIFLDDQLKPFKSHKPIKPAYSDGDRMVLCITRLENGLIEVETVDNAYKKMKGTVIFKYPYICGLETDNLYKFLKVGDQIVGHVVDVERATFSFEDEMKDVLVTYTRDEFPVGDEILARLKTTGKFFNWLGENGVLITSLPVEGVQVGDLAYLEITRYETGPNYGKINSRLVDIVPDDDEMFNENPFDDEECRREAVDEFVKSTPLLNDTPVTKEQTRPLDPKLIPLVLRMFYIHQRNLPKASDRICYLANAMALTQLIGDTTNLKFLRFSASYLRAIVSFAVNDNIHDIELSQYEEFADSEAFQTRLAVLDMLREYGSGNYSKKLQEAITRYEGNNELLAKLARLIQAANSIRETLTPATLNTLKREIVKNLSLETEENVEIDSYGAEYLGMESQTVEFKTSMVFPPNKGMQANQEEQTYNVMRAVCGFLNSQMGGTVYIGVNDQGYVSGLEADFNYLKCKEFDNYARIHILDRAIQKFGKEVMSFIHIEPQFKGRVAVVRVDPFPFGIIELDGKAFLKIDRETREMTAANRNQVLLQKTRKDLEKAGALDKLKQARFNKRRVILKGYASSSSGTIADRLVEVYEVMDADGMIAGIDCETRLNRLFKISRANHVEITDTPCECEHLYSAISLDSFLFTGNKTNEVNLQLDLCARNMLMEQYPRTATKIKRDANDCDVWYYTDSLYEGSIGVLARLCVSMADHLTILDAPELTAAVNTFKSKLGLK